MMKLVYMFYETSLDALDKGASINDIVKAEVRERIGRFKYTLEENVDEEYVKIQEELAKELGSLIGKEDL